MTASSEDHIVRNSSLQGRADESALEQQSPYKGKENRLNGSQKPTAFAVQPSAASDKPGNAPSTQRQAEVVDNSKATSSQASVKDPKSIAEKPATADEPKKIGAAQKQGQAAELLPDTLPLKEGYDGAVSQIIIESSAKEKAWAEGIATDGQSTQRLKQRLAELAATETAERTHSSWRAVDARTEANKGAKSSLAKSSKPCDLDIADDEVQPSASLQWQFHHQALKGAHHCWHIYYLQKPARDTMPRR